MRFFTAEKSHPLARRIAALQGGRARWASIATSIALCGGALPVPPAYAGDAPVIDMPVAVVTTTEQLATARKQIAAKDWGRAQATLLGAVKEEPGNADVQNLLAYTYRKQASPNLAKAFEHYKKALAINPKHLGAHEYVGEAYLMNKQPLEAQKHLAEIEKICGNRSCEQYEDLAKALADYKKSKP